jgi:hypothetical protein
MKAIIYKCASSLKWAIEINGAWDCTYYETQKGALIAAHKKYPSATISKWSDR